MMKKLLLFFLFVPLSTVIIAQAYVPFPTKHATWYESERSQTMNFQIQVCIDSRIYITGDTIINGLSYGILYRTIHDRSTFTGCGPPWQSTVSHGIYGFIRNDSINKRVWLRFPNHNADSLMYDFNLSLGGIIPKTIFNQYQIDPVKVLDIDTVVLGGIKRKRYLLSSICGDSTNYLIEGVGSTSGFTTGIINPWCTGYSNNLVCMTDGSKVYPDSLTSCQLITSLDEQTVDNIAFDIYPNPAKEQLNVSVEQGRTIQSIRLYDLMGREQTIEMEQQGNNNYILNLRSVLRGLCIVNITLEDGVQISEKVLKN